MANTIKLNTKDENLREILSNGKKYFVPRFQRDYSWETQQLEDFWEDISNLTKGDYHYMGYIVLQEKKDLTYKIIDGQQRLTTFSLMVLAAIKKLKEIKEKERAGNLFNNFVSTKNTKTLEYDNKLTLNKNNDFSYKRAVEGYKLPKRGEKKSILLMGKAIDFFYNGFKDKNYERIIDIVEKVSYLLFTSIYVSDEINAYKIFETLNSRGVKLTSGDLLKNYLFSLIDKDNDITESFLNDIEDKWGKIGNNIGSKTYPEYILAEWNSRHPLVRKADLFKSIRQEIKTNEDAEEYLNRLLDYSPLYAALHNSNDEFWADVNENIKIKQNLSCLKLFNIRQPISLLFICFIKHKENFSKILSWIVVFSIRYNIICKEHNGEQESLYNRICLNINDNCQLEEIKEELLTLYPNDNKFINSFLEKTMATSKSNKKARYLLARLQDKNTNEINEDNLSVEHILPINSNDEWQEYFGESWKIFKERLGNMALVTKGENKALDQKPFPEKKEILGASSHSINNISEYLDWTPKNIEERQKRMADLAAQTWRIE